MFQTFGSETSPDQGPPRLDALRNAMAKAGVDAFLVPRADAHQGEYVAPRDARLAWLTGFTGSAGFCAVLADQAGLFVDGRYRVQGRAQAADVFDIVHWPEVSLSDWLLDKRSGGTLGFDPWLHTMAEVKGLKRDLPGFDVTPIPNLIDQIWPDQPAPPTAPFIIQPDDLAGESHADKRARLAATLKTDAAILTLPDSIAWLLNIRGADIPRNPVPHSFAILHNSGLVDLFVIPAKVADLRDHLGLDVTVRDINDFLPMLRGLSGTVLVDPKSCAEAVRLALVKGAATLTEGQDPCVLPKARKNAAEIDGARAAHHRDGVAMARFLAWLDRTAGSGDLTEIDVVQKLEGFRRDTGALRDISFDTICGAGAHGAIVHYRVTEETNAPVLPGQLLLVDSGGQYADGTTDITRTMAIGTPTPEHKRQYTRVLQGMIAVSRARFPKGVEGRHLDGLARTPLWMAGQDYDHGTGHGVGSYLCVHEGPQGLSRRYDAAFEPGMILSNEPGYYREGHYGIRIENLIVVTPAPAIEGADEREMLAFETLTYVPLDRNLIDASMLSEAERHWIDGYHAEVLTRINPHLDQADKDWLQMACAPLT